MANAIGSDYLYKNAVLKELSRPSQERAQVSIEAPATDYVAGRTASDAQIVSNASDIAFKEAALRQKSNQFLNNILFAHDQLNQFSKNATLANLLGVGNLAVTGAKAYETKQAMEKQQKTVDEIMEMRRADSAAVKKAAADNIATFNTRQNQIKIDRADPVGEMAKDAASAYLPFSDEEMDAMHEGTVRASQPSNVPQALKDSNVNDLSGLPSNVRLRDLIKLPH